MNLALRPPNEDNPDPSLANEYKDNEEPSIVESRTDKPPDSLDWNPTLKAEPTDTSAIVDKEEAELKWTRPVTLKSDPIDPD